MLWSGLRTAACMRCWKLCKENQGSYSIHYFAGVKMASSSLSESREWLTPGSCGYFLPVGEDVREMYSCHLFFLNIRGLLRTATNLHPRRNCWAEMEMLLTVESASWNVYCIHYHVAGGGYKHTENLLVAARRVMQYAAARGPQILFSAIAKISCVFHETDFVPLSEMPKVQNLNSGFCILTVAPATRSLSHWDDEHLRCFCSAFPHLQPSSMWWPYEAITGLGLQLLGLFVTKIK